MTFDEATEILAAARAERLTIIRATWAALCDTLAALRAQEALRARIDSAVVHYPFTAFPLADRVGTIEALLLQMETEVAGFFPGIDLAAERRTLRGLFLHTESKPLEVIE